MDIAEIVTNKLIAELEAGTIPWKQPWTLATAARSVRGHEYRGINAMLLSLSKYTDPRWITYKQAQEMGGNVRKGEKGTPIVFWKFTEITTTDEDGNTINKKAPFLRYYTVFNVEQCDGLKLKPLPESTEHDIDPIDTAQAIIETMPNRPSIDHGGNRAYYSPSEDHVQLPPIKSFHTAEGYYSTAFHELVHSTGHANRCNRKSEKLAAFGSENYSKEELVAEIGSCFLCAHAAILPEQPVNHAAYIASWLRVLKNDRKMLIHAAGKAQTAYDYIIGKKSDEEKED